MKHLFKCPACQAYTLKSLCPNCQTPALSPRPPRFSPEDKYGNYRREQKKLILKEKGLY